MCAHRDSIICVPRAVAADIPLSFAAHMSLIGQLLRTKSLDDLVAETHQEGHQLKKVLGPWNLVALGVGAIIGAGIFATIGTAAAGDAHRPGAGPALMVSFILPAVVCRFSALCYAEVAPMARVSGTGP